MRIRMLSTRRGADDGKTLRTYEKGQEYTLPKTFRGLDLGKAFCEANWAVEVEAPPVDATPAGPSPAATRTPPPPVPEAPMTTPAPPATEPAPELASEPVLEAAPATEPAPELASEPVLEAAPATEPPRPPSSGKHRRKG